MADVSKVNVNSTDYNIKDSNAMHKGVDYVTAGKQANTTLGSKATAEGSHTTASGANTHAEGSYTTASSSNAHAEGSQTTASGAQAHSEGLSTTASGDYSHSEGLSTTASGNAAHTEGSLCEAAGSHAHAEGTWTKASSHDQHAEGKYNVEDTNGTYAHIIGGGTGDNARKNIFTVDWNGDVNAGRSNGLTNDTKLPTGADVISYLNSNLGNMIIRNGWNTNTISFALNFAVSPSKAAQAILMNANQALFAIIRIESGSQTVTKISGNTTVDVAIAGTETATTCTITTSNTMWGVSTLIAFHN